MPGELRVRGVVERELYIGEAEPPGAFAGVELGAEEERPEAFGGDEQDEGRDERRGRERDGVSLKLLPAYIEERSPVSSLFEA